MDEQIVQDSDRSMDFGDIAGADLARPVGRGDGPVGRRSPDAGMVEPGEVVDPGGGPVGRGLDADALGRGEVGGSGVGRGNVVGRTDNLVGGSRDDGVVARGEVMGPSGSGVNRRDAVSHGAGPVGRSRKPDSGALGRGGVVEPGSSGVRHSDVVGLGDVVGRRRVVDRASEAFLATNLNGRSWADIVADSQPVDRPVVPLPGVQFGGRIVRPVVLYTDAFKDVNSREVMSAVLKCVPVGTVKCLQQIPGARYRLSFRTLEAKQLFLAKEFVLRGERIVAQELDTPALFVRVLYVPDEGPNQTVSEALARYGKVLSVDREMYRDWPEVETGVRIAKLTDLTEGIPRRFTIGTFRVESRYCG